MQYTIIGPKDTNVFVDDVAEFVINATGADDEDFKAVTLETGGANDLIFTSGVAGAGSLAIGVHHVTLTIPDLVESTAFSLMFSGDVPSWGFDLTNDGIPTAEAIQSGMRVLGADVRVDSTNAGGVTVYAITYLSLVPDTLVTAIDVVAGAAHPIVLDQSFEGDVSIPFFVRWKSPIGARSLTFINDFGADDADPLAFIVRNRVGDIMRRRNKIIQRIAGGSRTKGRRR